MDTAHDAFIGIDSGGKVAAWNAQAEATFGWARSEVLGLSLADTIVPPAFRDAHNAGMHRFHETGEAPVVNQRLELTALHRSGREFPIELTITSPITVESGFFFAAFLRDISDRRERDEESRRARDVAEAATRAKSEFLANMSHELRTPLNGVLGYAQLLQRDRTMNAVREALDAIGRCGSQLLDLINDVLDLSKIEAGRLDIDETATDLTQLLTDLSLRRGRGRRAQRAGADDDARTGGAPRSDGRWPPSSGAPQSARQRRQVHERRRGAAGHQPQRRTSGFRSRGHRPGIEPESITEIFAAFAQTKSGAEAGARTRLTISDHLITKMGGAPESGQRDGRGQPFFFSLPLVEAHIAATAQTSDSGLRRSTRDSHPARC